jgi:hypothetical protein
MRRVASSACREAFAASSAYSSRSLGSGLTANITEPLAIPGPPHPVGDDLFGQFHGRCRGPSNNHQSLYAFRREQRQVLHKASAHAETNADQFSGVCGIGDGKRVSGKTLICKARGDIVRVAMPADVKGNSPDFPGSRALINPFQLFADPPQPCSRRRFRGPSPTVL